MDPLTSRAFLATAIGRSRLLQDVIFIFIFFCASLLSPSEMRIPLSYVYILLFKSVK